MSTLSRWIDAVLHRGPGYDTPTVMQAVVVRHIADGLTSGNETAATLARSLITELDAAGVPVDHLVGAEVDSLHAEQRAAGA